MIPCSGSRHAAAKHSLTSGETGQAGRIHFLSHNGKQKKEKKKLIESFLEQKSLYTGGGGYKKSIVREHNLDKST